MAEAVSAETSVHLSEQQAAYFETFGFLKLPGLFRDDIASIAADFDEAFSDERYPPVETRERVHMEQRRLTVAHILDLHQGLRRLQHDPRVIGVVTGLLGERWEYAGSDGSRFYCDTSWHCDIYGSPLTQYHVKLSLYLDPVSAGSGAIRMIPGTNHFRETFATALRANLKGPARIAQIYGVDGEQIPSWPLESEPGDLLVHSYRTIHASYNGGDGRRLIAINFREPPSPE